ncbi:MAG: hypothetical protein KGZ96_10140 [Clostridia bacterium]|nr:hypothetical protein [Clostridia bacterium]
MKNNIKTMLLATILILAVLTVTGCSSSNKPRISDTISTNDVLRTNNQKAITVKAYLLNPISEVGPELTFELIIDTHSVEISTYDILLNVSIITESGISLTGKDFLWESTSKESHHLSGLLIVPQEIVKLGPSLGELSLELYDLGSVPVRKLVWEPELLFNK